MQVASCNQTSVERRCNCNAHEFCFVNTTEISWTAWEVPPDFWLHCKTRRSSVVHFLHCSRPAPSSEPHSHHLFVFIQSRFRFLQICPNHGPDWARHKCPVTVTLHPIPRPFMTIVFGQRIAEYQTAIMTTRQRVGKLKTGVEMIALGNIACHYEACPVGGWVGRKEVLTSYRERSRFSKSSLSM